MTPAPLVLRTTIQMGIRHRVLSHQGAAHTDNPLLQPRLLPLILLPFAQGIQLDSMWIISVNTASSMLRNSLKAHFQFLLSLIFF